MSCGVKISKYQCCVFFLKAGETPYRCVVVCVSHFIVVQEQTVWAHVNVSEEEVAFLVDEMKLKDAEISRHDNMTT